MIVASLELCRTLTPHSPSQPKMHRLLPASRSWYALVVAVTLAACGGGDGPPTGNNSNTPAAVTPVATTAGQQAPAGTAVANAPAVRVTNSAGTGLSGVAVTFAVTAGGGSLASTTAQTNAQGVATAGAWTLGPSVGANTVRATVGSLSTTIDATAIAGAAANIAGVNTASLSGSAGAALATPITVKVTDAGGNAVAGATVQFVPTDGSGSVSAASVATTASGEAQTTWTLGADAGTDQLVATVAGTSVTTTISATATITPLTASRVDIGNTSARCVVRASGVVSCWGENAAGNLGDGTQLFRERPVDLAISGVTFSTVTLNSLHGCALTPAGAAYCWGRNTEGTVGDGTTADRSAPVAVTGNHAFTSLVTGPTYTCAIKADGSVWCWGTQNGGGAATQRTAPTQLNSAGRVVTSLSVALDRVCGAVNTGGVMCWTGDIFAAPAPAVTSTGLTFTALTGGDRHQCGIIADGRAYCWGFNAAGQLGTNDIDDRASPTLVVGPYRYSAIDAGVQHTCALATTGETYCWGRNTEGQLGINKLPTETTAAAFPSQVVTPAGVQFTRIAAGGYGSCGIAANDQVYCWGARPLNNSATVVAPVVAPVAVRDQ